MDTALPACMFFRISSSRPTTGRGSRTFWPLAPTTFTGPCFTNWRIRRSWSVSVADGLRTAVILAPGDQCRTTELTESDKITDPLLLGDFRYSGNQHCGAVSHPVLSLGSLLRSAEK